MAYSAQPPVPGDFRKLADLIKDVRVAMMMTRRVGAVAMAPRPGEMNLHARPMYTQKLDPQNFTGELWFFTDATSAKVDELHADPTIMLIYGDPGSNNYVVVQGTATVEHDERQARELWNVHAKGWWPEGPQSPTLRLIRVQVGSAEYWDGPSNTAYFLSLAKAVATGTQVKVDAEHGVVS